MLIIVLLLTGKVGDVDADEPTSALFIWHGSLGILVLLVAAVRIIWLFVHPAPPLPEGMKHVSRVLARSMHVALYGLLFALPLSGWLASSAEGASVSFFGIASLPAWHMQIPRQETSSTATGSEAAGTQEAGESKKELFEDVHEVLGNVLLALAGLHILAAFKHQLIDRDGLLSRMLPRAGWLRTGRPVQSVRMPRAP
ncbi:MAG: cytochrome b [Proteobacteria bacterium]|nr:cytochrome b [Pseudomonadota bacterium]